MLIFLQSTIIILINISKKCWNKNCSKDCKDNKYNDKLNECKTLIITLLHKYILLLSRDIIRMYNNISAAGEESHVREEVFGQ